VSLRTSARRYAKALFDVAIAESDPAVVERDLASLLDAMQSHPEFRRVLTAPGIPHSARVGLMQAYAQRAGAQPPVAKLLALLAERGRLALLPDLIAVYRERLLEHAHIVRAVVTSASPLSPNYLRRVEQRLGELTGKTVQLDARVDESLVGGLVTRIGSTVYDGSVRTQLSKMKQQLVENA
jgi:F-type H+-transporting ATPase subunit delta